MILAMKLLQQYQLANTSQQTLSEKSLMSVNSNPTAASKNICMKKLTDSIFFSFIVCIVDSGVINLYF
jgi:hypothetical protein